MTKILPFLLFVLLSFQVVAFSEDPIEEFQSSFISNDEWLLANDRVRISNVYPNPAVDYVSFRYELQDHQAKVQVIIRNILGSEVEHYVLSSHQRNLVINTESYKAGMYYFTISIDGKHEVTKKFIIKK